MSYESTIDDKNQMLGAKRINPNSNLGKSWKINPARMQELEDAFGSDLLNYIFR